jgi:alpha-L-rhamnosidase
MGATTVWERWDSMLPDGSINPGEMTSFNHYALGAVADWLHRTVAGLAPAAPAYRELLVRPLPGGGLTSASARHETPYGPATVSWERHDGRFALSVEVPVGSSATVHVPGEPEPVRVMHGTHNWDVADPSGEQARLSADATIRDLLDHAEAWPAVASAAVAHSRLPDDVAAAGRLERFLDAPLTDLSLALDPESSFHGAEELDAALEEALTRYR